MQNEITMNDLQIKNLNKDVREWSKASAYMMKKKVRLLTNSEKHIYLRIKRVRGIRKGKSGKIRNQKLAQSISYKVNRRFGIAERIIFPFAKHGFFIAVGASRGHHYQKNPRKKIDWYGFVFEERLEQLADKVMENYADATLNTYSKIGKTK